MSEQLFQEPVAEVVADPGIRRLREYVSATIALVIILGAIVMIIQAFSHLASADEFARVKDLLLFVNPLLGVAIGYYFNRVTSEARAETAETTAKGAMATAQQEAGMRDKAETEAKAAKSEAKELTLALKEVGEAAEKLMAQTPAPAAGTLSVDETGEPGEDPRLALQMAWTRAQRLIE